MPASLSAILDTAFALLAEGVADPASPFRTPTLASLGADEYPALRSVVLRGADIAARCLEIHTDTRSAKFAEISVNPRAALHIWDAARRIQLRLRGTVALHVADGVAEAAWARLSPSSRSTYCVAPGPGVAIASPHATHAVGEDAGFSVFCVLRLAFAELEWLHLEHGCHNRASFRWHNGEVTPTWLAP
jgi:pyridoxine/pyridoxamine 5'-phosphate oxidase